jgi:transcription elongation factor GreA
MECRITSSDAQELKKKIANKKRELDVLGLELGDAMSRTGSFPASSPEYAAVYLEMQNLQQSIDRIKNSLGRYTVIDADKLTNKKINVYSQVRLLTAEDVEMVVYVGIPELEHSLAAGILLASPESPLGEALLGHKVGDSVTVRLPAGEKQFTVSEIVINT